MSVVGRKRKEFVKQSETPSEGQSKNPNLLLFILLLGLPTPGYEIPRYLGWNQGRAGFGEVYTIQPALHSIHFSRGINLSFPGQLEFQENSRHQLGVRNLSSPVWNWLALSQFMIPYCTRSLKAFL